MNKINVCKSATSRKFKPNYVFLYFSYLFVEIDFD